VLAELRAKRDQIDAAIAAIESARMTEAKITAERMRQNRIKRLRQQVSALEIKVANWRVRLDIKRLELAKLEHRA